jgi:hypothetical protein
LLVGVKYGGSFMGPTAATVAMKALQEPGKDGRTGSGEVETGLGSQWRIRHIHARTHAYIHTYNIDTYTRTYY